MNTVGRLLGQILRFLFAWIDAIVARVITEVYNLLIQLSELVLYSDNIIKTIGRRIGLLLGIFMLFRIAISLVDYMISPDKVKDSAKGGGKLVINVVVSLVLLVTINIIFEQAYKIQTTIIDSHMIEKIFFGASSNTDMDVGYYLYSSFFVPNTDVFGDSCDRLWDTTFELNGSEGKECDDKLYNLLDDSGRSSIYDAKKNLQMSNVFSNYSLVLATSNNDFAFNYIPILSSVAGIIILLVLISFGMDLATRAVKLLFLQIIAPIPIIYNIDPGKGKDVFQKWYKECFSTYLSVFLRLIAINFAVFMIVLIKGNFKDVFANNWLLNVFIIIGCLMFAKQVPKLLEDMLGIKTDGMALNPLKKFQEQALFGKNISGVGKGAIGGVGGTIAGARAGSRVGNTFGGALAGAFMGASTAKNSSKNPFTTSVNDVYKKLVGSDFVNFSVTKALLGIGAEGRVKEIKDARNVANAVLNDYNTKLNTSQRRTASLAESLSDNKDIDFSDLNGSIDRISASIADNDKYLSANQDAYNAAKDELAKSDGEKAKHQEIIDRNKELISGIQTKADQLLEDIKKKQAEYDKLPNHNPNDFENIALQKMKQEYGQYQSTISSTQSSISDAETEILKIDNASSKFKTTVDKYEEVQRSRDNSASVLSQVQEYNSLVEEQNTLRSRISAVQKDIDDLSSEKGQRERFYGYDPSPQENVQAMLDATKDETTYRKRIEEPKK